MCVCACAWVCICLHRFLIPPEADGGFVSPLHLIFNLCQFWDMAWVRRPTLFLSHVDIPLLSSPVWWKAVHSSLNCLGTTVGNQHTVNVRVSFWTLSSILWIYMSDRRPVSHQFPHYYSFPVSLKLGSVSSPPILSSFLKTFWLFWVLWISKNILESAHQCLHRR